MTQVKVEVVETILIDRISPDPEQPRKYFNEDEEQRLADSIKKYGLIQPILVRKVQHLSYDYVIVHGERRFRAHKRLGLRTINGIIREIEDSKARDLQLLENVQRKDLSDIELAWEFQRRVNLGQTHEQIAQVIGKDRSYVTQRLSLLRLSESDQKRMLMGELGFSQARALLSVKGSELRQRVSAMISGETTLRETERIIREEIPEPNSNVTRVTSSGAVRVAGLHVWSTIHDKDGSLRETVPWDELIWAYVEDLKQLKKGNG